MCAHEIKRERRREGRRESGGGRGNGRAGGREWYQASVGLSYQAKCSKGTIVRAR